MRSNALGRLRLALLVSAFGLWHAGAPAAAPKVEHQVAGFFRTQVGDFEVTSLTDGAFSMPPGLMKADQDQVVQLIAHDFPSDPPKFDASVAGFLVNTGHQLILVTPGSGTSAKAPPPASSQRACARPDTGRSRSTWCCSRTFTWTISADC